MDANFLFYDEDESPVAHGDDLTGIESPDITKMLPLKRGSAIFYFHTEEKRQSAIEKFKKLDTYKTPRQIVQERIEMIEALGLTCATCIHRYYGNGKSKCDETLNRERKGVDKSVTKATKACMYYGEI